MIKLFKPYVSEESKRLVQEVLNSDNLAEGLLVKQFENEFGRTFNKKNVIALNSGTSALELAYELAGITKDSEVLTPVLTCTATNIPLVRRGAKIVFIDTDYDLNINIQDVKNKITSKTKAIVFVHFGGNNRGLKELLTICRKRKITLIEDAAQAVGSGYWAVGDFTCVSLQAIKTLTSGDGGFLITRKKTDFNKARRLRWFGYDRELKQKLGDIDLKEAGYKYHMNNITAAIGLGNLREIDKILAHRWRLAKIYESHGFNSHVWLVYGMSKYYKLLKLRCNKAGFEIGQHHYRNDKYSLFKKFKNKCPIMDEIEGKYFFLPYHTGVSLADAYTISKIIQI